MKLKAYPFYPGEAIGSQGIDVTVQGSHWTVSFNDQEFPIAYNYTTKPTDYSLVYDTLLKYYFLVPTSSLL